MINSKINQFIKILLCTVLIFIFSCDEQDTVVISPPNANTFKANSFLIDSENSFSFKFNSYNAGDMPFGYVGNVDEVTNSKFLVKIDKNLIAENNLCNDENHDLVFNTLELRLWLKNSITLEANSNVIGVEASSNINSYLNDNSFGNFDCMPINPGENCEGTCVDNWVYQDLNEQSCLAQTNSSWTIEGINGDCGYIDQADIDEGCCKYWDCISCCEGSTINNDQLINVYAIESSFLDSYDEYTDSINHSLSTNWIDNIEYALSSSFVDPFRLSIDLYDYLVNKYGISNNEDLNLCNLQDDISILIEIGQYFSENFGAEYLDFYTTDDTNPSYFYYKPHLVINHSVESTEQIKIPKYTIDNDFISINNSINTDLHYTVTNSDTINVISFSGLNQFEDCSNSLLNESCVDNLTPVINSGFNGELFNFDITIDDDYLNKIAELDTLNDIVKLKFQGVQFIIEDLDPLNDDYDIDNNPDGTEGNLIYDTVESFDDFGLDFCPDQYEDGQGGCLCDYYNGDECNNLNQNLIIYNLNGLEGDGIYNDLEFFDSSLDTGSDGCFSQYEDGNNGCIGLDDTPVYDPNTNPDPNRDDFNLDPGNDNWGDCGSDGSCNIEDEDGTQGNGIWDQNEGTEDNFQYDNSELWVDAGLDQLFSINEPGFHYIDNPDPNGDDYHIENNPNGTEGNFLYDSGEWFFDFGSDGIDNEDEYDIGYSSSGKENNGIYDNGEDWIEAGYDTGEDQCLNQLEDGNGGCINPANDTAVYDPASNPDPNGDDFNIDPNNDNNILQNNGSWDFLDYGVDGCVDQYEDGNGDCINDGNPVVYDEVLNPDPNNDNYNQNDNPNGTEGNEQHDYDYSISNLTYWVENNGEKFEGYYDYGIGELSPEEDNYYGNNTLVSVPSLFYFDTFNNMEVADSLMGEKVNNSDANVFLWINKIEKIDDNKYNISVNLESLVDIIAYEIHLYHDSFQYEVGSVGEDQIGIWPYGSGDDINNNIDNSGQKYIFDSSIYGLDESFCDFESDFILDDLGSIKKCSENSDLILSNAYGIKNKLKFKDEDGNYFSDFLNNLKDSNQFTVFSDEYTKLILYFDKEAVANSITDNPLLHNVEQYTEFKIEYYDEDLEEYVYYPINNLSVTINEDYIAIPIVYVIQSYLVGDLNIFENDFNIILSTASNRYNFSRISIDKNSSRIEVFYSE